ncbi:hypothetical protein ACFV4F_19320 [Kitasatospora sp. NPDC059722]|uniref:hypothetical protein n=1 Tax=Kitasatospora sp. NPDC059722 TaxID=3346925 RepID=UPI00368AEE7B
MTDTTPEQRIAHLTALLTPVLDALPPEQAQPIREALEQVRALPTEDRERQRMAVVMARKNAFRRH